MLVIAATALAPAAAQASRTQASIMMDDDLLLYRGDSIATGALTHMKAPGVDAIRVTVLSHARPEPPRLRPRRTAPDLRACDNERPSVVGAHQRSASPRPHAPLTEADGYRAWRLYTAITGHVPAGDPFDR